MKIKSWNDPEALFRTIEKKRETIARVLPDLRALYTTQKNKPKIRFYNGLEQIQEIYRHSLEAKEIFAIGSLKGMVHILPEFSRWYQKELKHRNIVFHDISSYSSAEKVLPEARSILKGLHGAKVLPRNYQELPLDILIWNNNLGIINLEAPHFSTVLNHPSVATTFRILFHFMWDRME